MKISFPLREGMDGPGSRIPVQPAWRESDSVVGYWCRAFATEVPASRVTAAQMPGWIDRVQEVPGEPSLAVGEAVVWAWA